MNIIKIISGGQWTNRGGYSCVDAVIECNVSYGGWLSKEDVTECD